MLIGWMQFSEKLRIRRLTWHRNIGKVYVIAALVSGAAGVYISFYTTGGIIASLGFLGLGLSWGIGRKGREVTAKVAKI